MYVKIKSKKQGCLLLGKAHLISIYSAATELIDKIVLQTHRIGILRHCYDVIVEAGKAIEQEYRLHPDPTMMEVRDRLSNQVWDLLQILQERVDQHTCNNKDMKLIIRLLIQI